MNLVFKLILIVSYIFNFFFQILKIVLNQKSLFSISS